MTAERADLGFGAALDDLSDFQQPSASVAAPTAAKDETEKAAEAAGFTSREPRPGAPAPRQRRRRTGRNVQFNIKSRQETVDAFCSVADEKGWGLGETLERAVELLLQEHGSGGRGQ